MEMPAARTRWRRRRAVPRPQRRQHAERQRQDQRDHHGRRAPARPSTGSASAMQRRDGRLRRIGAGDARACRRDVAEEAAELHRQRLIEIHAARDLAPCRRGSARSPSRLSTGSPGMRCTSRNTSTETPSTATRLETIRWRRKRERARHHAIPSSAANPSSQRLMYGELARGRAEVAGRDDRHAAGVDAVGHRLGAQRAGRAAFVLFAAVAVADCTPSCTSGAPTTLARSETCTRSPSPILSQTAPLAVPVQPLLLSGMVGMALDEFAMTVKKRTQS